MSQPPLQELENLRKQAEIIPQLMAECESVTEKLQVGPESDVVAPRRSEDRAGAKVHSGGAGPVAPRRT